MAERAVVAFRWASDEASAIRLTGPQRYAGTASNAPSTSNRRASGGGFQRGLGWDTRYRHVAFLLAV